MWDSLLSAYLGLHREINMNFEAFKTGLFNFYVIFEEHEDHGDRYVVAECLELPGCISQGANRAEAAANIESAMRACLNVVFEDSLERALADSVREVPAGSERMQVLVDPTPTLKAA